MGSQLVPQKVNGFSMPKNYDGIGTSIDFFHETLDIQSLNQSTEAFHF